MNPDANFVDADTHLRRSSSEFVDVTVPYVNGSGRRPTPPNQQHHHHHHQYLNGRGLAASSSNGAYFSSSPVYQDVVSTRDLKEQVQSLLALLMTFLMSLIRFFYATFKSVSTLAFDRALGCKEKSVQDQVVLITGSAGYLGRNLAWEFAKRGAILALWDINESENAKTLGFLESRGLATHARVFLYKVDASSTEQVKRAAKQMREDMGGVEPAIVLMAAAPSFVPKSIMEPSLLDDFEKHYKLGLLAQVATIQEFMPGMIQSGRPGHFVSISSSSAVLDVPFIVPYATIKTAQAKLLESVREELVFNQMHDQIKTSVVYMDILKEGLAHGFDNHIQFDFDGLTSAYAAENIVRGVLRDQSVVYVKWHLQLALVLKYVSSPRVLGMIVAKKTKVHQKLLVLQKILMTQQATPSSPTSSPKVQKFD